MGEDPDKVLCEEWPKDAGLFVLQKSFQECLQRHPMKGSMDLPCVRKKVRIDGSKFSADR